MTSCIVDWSFPYISGSSFSTGGIFSKSFFKRFFCSGVSFFADGGMVGFFEEELGVDLFFDKQSLHSCTKSFYLTFIVK